ncbi:MAG: dephospho-CoA kinase, partial [Pseudomonadota bacterium]
IFSDAEARSRLENILHPLIRQQARDQLAAVTAPYAILVVPLLVESGVFNDADRVVVVDVPEDVQMQRLMRRDGLSEVEAKRALHAQASRQQRLEKADDVLLNTGSMEALQQSVAELHGHYLVQAEAGN